MVMVNRGLQKEPDVFLNVRLKQEDGETLIVTQKRGKVVKLNGEQNVFHAQVNLYIFF